MRKRVRISWPSQLILFSLFLLVRCAGSQDTLQKNIVIRWKNNQAMGLSMALGQFEAHSKETLPELLKVQLANSKTAILGDYSILRDSVIFEPLIPFTPGLQYEVLLENRLVGEIDIPQAVPSTTLIGIYPSQDTLPENLLKFYFVFSRPMREGRSLAYVSLLNAKGDTLPGTFLNLQPELWNAEKTVLTLWLDPGRIKRDLQPNKSLGAPLTKGNHYTLVVSERWPDELGAGLTQSYTKRFVAATRDMTSPDVKSWTIKIPSKGTTQALEIHVKEALDYVLLQNTIRIIDARGKIINGVIQISNKEHLVDFIPASPWLAGAYKVLVESRLEDLAGNNLNRLFDRDITDRRTKPSQQTVFELNYRID
ncbi:hypothetical protein [Runella salmonicolor]|uniref:SbsA Ig-like domain-containing protein n=1 Tax=Runella salmonicolor TaxID=2950278 RepID=A0ABT1FUV2_9BACT|nr:hypothetical protein [Runella salmonicolor]MCP1385481.1 hypothetical protein [Runella salmonicolor]